VIARRDGLAKPLLSRRGGLYVVHRASQSSTGLEVDDERRKSLGEKGWARRGRLWCVVWSRVARTPRKGLHDRLTHVYANAHPTRTAPGMPLPRRDV
jgi:hypothetical protein